MKGIIFAIGSEILDGKTIDTNSSYLYNFCRKFNIKINKKIILSDSPTNINNSIKKEISENDFLFFIGGLGPTFDDVTLDSVCKFLNIKPEIDEQQSKKILDFLNKKNIIDINLINLNLRQARYIGHSLKNNIGHAIGSYYSYFSKKNKKQIFILPGPPNEFIDMVNTQVSPILENLCGEKRFNKDIYVYNISESTLDNLIRPLKLKTLKGIYAKFHLKILSFESSNFKFIIEDLSKIIKIKSIVGYYIKELYDGFVFNKNLLNTKKIIADNSILITEPIEFEKLFFDLLEKFKLTFSAAESCSGGLLSHKFTSIPSASNYFLGSIVCYSNLSKEKLLNIDKSILIKYGAVSRETAKEMAKNCQNIFNSNISLSITGLAGPDSDSSQLPVGTCFLGISFYKDSKNLIDVFECSFNGNRNTIQNLSIIFSMFLAIYIIYD